MKNLFFAIITVCTVSVNAQTSDSLKNRNYFGLSFEVGGGLERQDVYGSDGVSPTDVPTIGMGLFWNHQKLFSKHHALIIGGGITWNAFTTAVNYQYEGSWLGEEITVQSVLGKGIRSHIFTIDLPIYYAYRIQSKLGVISPYAGVNVRSIVGLADQNHSGGGSYSSFEYNGNEYYSEYENTYSTGNILPFVQPTLGVSIEKIFKNGSSMKFSADFKAYLNTPYNMRVYNQSVFYRKGDAVILTPTGPVNVDAVPIDFTNEYMYLNMSRFALGISYSFR